MSMSLRKEIPSLNDAKSVVLPSDPNVPTNRFTIHDAVHVCTLQKLILAWRGKRSHHDRPFASVENRDDISWLSEFRAKS